MEFKSSKLLILLLKATVSVEPYWNLNINDDKVDFFMQKVSVEPYWNLNKHTNNNWIYINCVSVEPYWNLNPFSTISIFLHT